jgi:hypothetical protein
MAVPVTIGDQNFDSKKAALEAIRGIRDRYPDNVALEVDDDRFVRCLLALHPEADQKIGAGVSHFTVATEAEFGGRNRHFVVHRILGGPTDFSFVHCLHGKSKDRNDRLMALRQAIKEQTWRFRDWTLGNGRVFCPYEGIELTATNSHIDHAAPDTFESLVLRWLSAAGISIDAVEITPPADNQLVAYMINKDQLASWHEFHKEHAKLRLLSVRGNLSGAKRKS